MRIEIAEQLALCAIEACDLLTVENKKDGTRVQLSGMYAKVASFGSCITTLGLIPTAMMFEEDRENESRNPMKKDGDHHVNDAVYKTLKAFTDSEGIKDIWKPDERLRQLMQQHKSLLDLFRALGNAADYYLVKEYSLLACASLKLALNTYPDPEKVKKTKGSDEHDG